jgi:AcrR family transcriptional regulator
VAQGNERRRDRYRAQVRAEIKEIALARIAADGVAALTLTAIARELGVSGPALYKYFGGRDELLTELISDGCTDLAATLRSGADCTAGQPARARLHALAAAYRDWAVAAPHRYLLLTGTPVARHAGPPGPTAGARGVLCPLIGVLAAGTAWAAAEPLRAELAQWIATEPAIGDWVRGCLPPGATIPADIVLAWTVTAWVRLHGVVGVEAAGSFAGMGLRPGTVLAVEVEALADSVGLPAAA